MPFLKTFNIYARYLHNLFWPNNVIKNNNRPTYRLYGTFGELEKRYSWGYTQPPGPVWTGMMPICGGRFYFLRDTDPIQGSWLGCLYGRLDFSFTCSFSKPPRGKQACAVKSGTMVHNILKHSSWKQINKFGKKQKQTTAPSNSPIYHSKAKWILKPSDDIRLWTFGEDTEYSTKIWPHLSRGNVHFFQRKFGR